MAKLSLRNRGLILIIIGVTIIITAIIWNFIQPADNLLILPLGLLGGISLFIGIVNLFLSHKEKEESITDIWECEECGAGIAETDKKCPKCGAEFEGD